MFLNETLEHFSKHDKIIVKSSSFLSMEIIFCNYKVTSYNKFKSFKKNWKHYQKFNSQFSRHDYTFPRICSTKFLYLYYIQPIYKIMIIISFFRTWILILDFDNRLSWINSIKSLVWINLCYLLSIFSSKLMIISIHATN